METFIVVDVTTPLIGHLVNSSKFTLEKITLYYRNTHELSVGHACFNSTAKMLA